MANKQQQTATQATEDKLRHSVGAGSAGPIEKANESADLMQASLDDGFEEETTGAKGWWQIEEGAKFTGVLLDRVRRHDWDDRDPKTHQFTYIFETLAACTINVGSEEMPEEVPKGTLVFVDEKHQLKRLAQYMADGPGAWVVQIVALEKVDIKKGRNTMWMLKWGTKPNPKHPKAATLTKPSRYAEAQPAPVPPTTPQTAAPVATA